MASERSSDLQWQGSDLRHKVGKRPQHSSSSLQRWMMSQCPMCSPFCWSSKSNCFPLSRLAQNQLQARIQLSVLIQIKFQIKIQMKIKTDIRMKIQRPFHLCWSASGWVCHIPRHRGLHSPSPGFLMLSTNIFCHVKRLPSSDVIDVIYRWCYIWNIMNNNMKWGGRRGLILVLENTLKISVLKSFWSVDCMSTVNSIL